MFGTVGERLAVYAMVMVVMVVWIITNPQSVAYRMGVGDCTPGGTLTISSTTTITGGCYASTDSNVPAINITTGSAVTLNRVRIEHTGIGVRSTATANQITIRNSIFIQRYLSVVDDHRAVDIFNPSTFTAENNLLQDGDGILIVGPATPSSVTIRFNVINNVGKYVSDAVDDCCVQAVQLNQIDSADIEIAWNKVTNTEGISRVEDNINFFNAGGTGTGTRSDVHHNLIDGAYDRNSATTDYTGGGILVGDSGSAHNMVRDNVVVSTTNHGVSINGDDNFANDNLLVNDAVEQQSDFGQAVLAHDTVTPAGFHTSGNEYNWHRTSGGAQFACFTSTFCGNGSEVSTTEAQARAVWEADRVANSVVVGPQ